MDSIWHNNYTLVFSQSQSQSIFTTSGLPPISFSWRQASWGPRSAFFQLNLCSHSPYVTSCLTRGWVCSLELLLTLASAVILRSVSRWTLDHILLSQIRDSLSLEDQVPVFISPRNRVSQFYPQARGSIFFDFYDSQGFVEVFEPASTRESCF
jgi:hypothetical protein